MEWGTHAALIALRSALDAAGATMAVHQNRPDVLLICSSCKLIEGSS
jgi:hypothetical protein